MRSVFHGCGLLGRKREYCEPYAFSDFCPYFYRQLLPLSFCPRPQHSCLFCGYVRIHFLRYTSSSHIETISSHSGQLFFGISGYRSPFSAYLPYGPPILIPISLQASLPFPRSLWSSCCTARYSLEIRRKKEFYPYRREQEYRVREEYHSHTVSRCP